MAKNYSFEKGKYGLTTGTIVPFAILLSGESPAEPDWVRYVPAGFLRCRGQVLKSRDYIGLSQILGIGSNSKFRKENRELEEPSEDFRQGEFQLPDLGSKYMRASTANGIYNNLTVLDPFSGRTVQRVGVEVELNLNQGNQIDFFYSGSFVVPEVPIPFSPSSNFVSTLDGITGDAGFSAEQALSHGHYSNSAISWRNEALDTRNDRDLGVGINSGSVSISDPPLNQQNNRNDPDNSVGSGYFVEQFTTLTSITGAASETLHSHGMSKSPISKNIDSNFSQFQISPTNVVTRVNLSSKNIFKMDDIQHRFVIVEFLIKI
jgi:hypothetical protein